MTDTSTRPSAWPGLHGQLVWPDDPGYDDVRRVFNAMVDRRPAVVVRCADAQDVVLGLAHARTTGAEVTVYGGGHGVTGSAVADDAVCLDLRGMKGIRVDPVARTAEVETGCTWGELDAATQEHGLAVTGGRVSTTGVAGLALGSGSGWLERSLGFTCDNLLAAELVTAAGQVVTASAGSNPELFWGIRGGGGNFGVVTRMTLRLDPVGPLLLGGMLLYPAAQALEVVRSWTTFMATAPDEVGGAVAFVTAPPADFVPPALRGQPAVGVVVCYLGDVDRGREVLAPLLGLGAPAVTMVQPMPYVALQELIDGANRHGLRNYWSADFYGELPEEALETLCASATRAVSPLTQAICVRGGGAVGRVPEDATAFGNRAALYNVHYLSMWADASEDGRNVAWTRAILAAMKPWSTGGVYLNFIGDEGQARVRSAFTAGTWDRLRALKRVWDPDNVFRHNQNIPPA